MPMPWYKKLHWRIITGLVLGLIYGVAAAAFGWGTLTNHWISPFGTIFINLLKLIAVPLILASLVTGVASLSDLKKLSRIGGKTIAIYIGTTAVAVTIGLLLVNLLGPGYAIPGELQEELGSLYHEEVSARAGHAETVKGQGPLQALVDVVPDNFFGAAADNRNMLQVVFFAILLGIGLIQVPAEKARPVLRFFDGLNAVVIRLVDLIMLMAPLGVFALMAGMITTVAGDDVSRIINLLGALGFYCFTVISGLALHMAITFSVLIRFFTPMKLRTFYAGIAPAQLLAFSTSSSAATLPVTMERCEEKLGISEEISSFVLPLGATINMDGTALYQGVATVFIAQALGIGLGFGAQLTIVLTAVLASIGTAAVPGAGIIMLLIILESVGVPASGIALILGVDRILDMLRTVTNVTGDAAVASVVAASEGQLGSQSLDESSDALRTTAERDLHRVIDEGE